tara:strand:+ start:1256 stop:1645 length:390 start_codon:yes stop_codon:yes gene_type:complete
MQGAPPQQQLDGVWTQQPGQYGQPGQHGQLGNHIPLQPGMAMGYFAPTQATLALILGILGFVGCSICTAIPGVILANSALVITGDQPGHPDAGTAKAAQVISWISIGLAVLGLLFYGAMFALLAASGEL